MALESEALRTRPASARWGECAVTYDRERGWRTGQLTWCTIRRPLARTGVLIRPTLPYAAPENNRDTTLVDPELDGRVRLCPCHIANRLPESRSWGICIVEER